MKFLVKVPATVANIGSGFDTIGMAINIFNETTFEFKRGAKKINIYVDGFGRGELEKKEKNLLLKVLRKFLSREIFSLNILQKNNIPLRRGLGSSSAAVITGIVAGFLFSGRKIDKELILKEAAELEGHPDNVSPAIFGGINIVKKDEKIIRHIKILPEKDLKVLLLVPDFEISTEKARKILPQRINLNDVVSNIQNFGFLVSSFYKFNIKNLITGVKDFIHQPYRLRLIKGGKRVIDKAINMGFPAGISGSGPAIFCFAEKGREKKVLKILKNVWKKANRTIEIDGYICKINRDGLKWRFL